MKKTSPSIITERIIKSFKKGRANPIFAYIISLLTTFFTFISVIFLITKIPGISPFLFLLLPVIFNSWYGGFKSGITSIIISTFSIIYTFFIPDLKTTFILNDAFLIDFSSFILISTLFIYIINKFLKPDKSIAFEKITQEYLKLILELEKKYKKAQDDIKARDDFLAVASHELKTPVTSMLLQVQLAIHNIRNVSLAKFSVANLLQMLDSTEQQSKRLSKMVNDLLNTSLITTGRLELEMEECDLAKIANDISLRFAEKLKKENTQLHLKTPKPVIGKMDRLRIEQAISNLISNAIKYGQRNPIYLTVTNSNLKGRVIVQDQGIGISKASQEKIFGRFKRAVNNNEYKGLGVGLYITDQIVKAHNGKIIIASKPGKGTTFTIEIPLENS